MSPERYPMKYPFVIEPAAGNLAASLVQFPGAATAADRSKLERLMAEQLALVLHDYAEQGETPPAPVDAGDVDLSEYEEGSEVVYVEPAPLNPVALAIEAKLKQQGVNQSELARRMGVPRSVISRLTNPFYWGHSLKSLNDVARALDARLEVGFLANHEKPSGVPAAS